ncbi:MAG: hypothetical protein WCT52_00920 [Candidatus Micrarchaeia archaeon]|jgi:hypothetical protein
MKVFQLPKETVAAIKNGNSFKGIENYTAWQKTKAWMFPNNIPQNFDKNLMKFFSAHLDNLNTVHRAEIEASLDKGKYLSDAEKNMMNIVREESNFNSVNVSNFVVKYAAAFFEHHTKSLDIGKMEGIIGKIAFANAVADLWKNFHIEDAISMLYVAEVNNALKEAAYLDKVRGVDGTESYNGMVDAINRLYK